MLSSTDFKPSFLKVKMRKNHFTIFLIVAQNNADPKAVELFGNLNFQMLP
ncbi:MAG: hypothetical protein ACI9RO_001430 [Alteromonas macleodii]|jgi:hypothetical protein|tara:strand:+ start:337 stop:486 length:150 start_codon:yes stop_codon:yes gene_type:complete